MKTESETSIIPSSLLSAASPHRGASEPATNKLSNRKTASRDVVHAVGVGIAALEGSGSDSRSTDQQGSRSGEQSGRIEVSSNLNEQDVTRCHGDGGLFVEAAGVLIARQRWIEESRRANSGVLVDQREVLKELPQVEKVTSPSAVAVNRYQISWNTRSVPNGPVHPGTATMSSGRASVVSKSNEPADVDGVVAIVVVGATHRDQAAGFE